MLHHVKIQYYKINEEHNLAHYAYVTVFPGIKIDDSIFIWTMQHPEAKDVYLVENSIGKQVRERYL